MKLICYDRTSNYHGDPSAAMLEVLDPEQNHTFTDHYVNIPIDLSKVLFIATANSLETIPPPLLDRMETINLPGYTTLEKRHIATRHLIPKQIQTSKPIHLLTKRQSLTSLDGLASGQVEFNQDVVSKIIESYTRESGVRNLEREIGSVCRAKAVEYADAKDAGRVEKYNPQLSVDDLEEILGIEKYDEEIAEKTRYVRRIDVLHFLLPHSPLSPFSYFPRLHDCRGGSGVAYFPPRGT